LQQRLSEEEHCKLEAHIEASRKAVEDAAEAAELKGASSWMRTVADVQAQKCRHQERRARFEEQTRQRLLAAFLAAAGFSSVNEHKEKRYMLRRSSTEGIRTRE